MNRPSVFARSGISMKNRITCCNSRFDEIFNLAGLKIDFLGERGSYSQRHDELLVNGLAITSRSRRAKES